MVPAVGRALLGDDTAWARIEMPNAAGWRGAFAVKGSRISIRAGFVSHRRARPCCRWASSTFAAVCCSRGSPASTRSVNFVDLRDSVLYGKLIELGPHARRVPHDLSGHH